MRKINEQARSLISRAKQFRIRRRRKRNTRKVLNQRWSEFQMALEFQEYLTRQLRALFEPLRIQYHIDFYRHLDENPFNVKLKSGAVLFPDISEAIKKIPTPTLTELIRLIKEHKKVAKYTSQYICRAVQVKYPYKPKIPFWEFIRITAESIFTESWKTDAYLREAQAALEKKYQREPDLGLILDTQPLENELKRRSQTHS